MLLARFGLSAVPAALAGAGAAWLLTACAAAVPDPVAVQASTPAAQVQDGGSARGAAAPASVAGAPASVWQLQIDGDAAVVGDRSFDSGISVAGLDRRLQYRAGYQLLPDPSARGAAAPGAMPAPGLGKQRWDQQLKLQLPSLYGAPVLLGARALQQESLLPEAARSMAEQSMDLNWSPRFAALALSWQPEGAGADAMQALQCDVRGSVSLPLPAGAGAVPLAVEGGGRSCRVVGDEARVAALTAETWAAGLRWAYAQQETRLRMQTVTPGGEFIAAGQVPVEASGAAYELKLAQTASLGAWAAQAGVAWRRPPVATGGRPDRPWAASAEVSRQLAAMSIAASWRRADPYWFVPELKETADQFALSLDFSPWMSTRWHGSQPRLAMSYSRARYAAAAARDNDSLLWNLSIPWR